MKTRKHLVFYDRKRKKNLHLIRWRKWWSIVLVTKNDWIWSVSHSNTCDNQNKKKYTEMFIAAESVCKRIVASWNGNTSSFNFCDYPSPMGEWLKSTCIDYPILYLIKVSYSQLIKRMRCNEINPFEMHGLFCTWHCFWCQMTIWILMESGWKFKYPYAFSQQWVNSGFYSAVWIHSTNIIIIHEYNAQHCFFSFPWMW